MSSFGMNNMDLTQQTIEGWDANRSLWLLIGDEQQRYQDQIQGAVDALNERPRGGGRQSKVHLLCHDRFSGFHVGMPNNSMPKDKSNVLGLALQRFIGTDEEVAAAANQITLPFPSTDDAILLVKGCDVELRDQPPMVTFLRNIVQCNMCSGTYHETREQSPRGQRMIILVSTTTEVPESFPELKPEVVPLPDHNMMLKAVRDTFDPLHEANAKSSKRGVPAFDNNTRSRIADSLAGMTDQEARDALALAAVRHIRNGEVNTEDLLDTIEKEKARAIAKVPGMTYISKGQVDQHLLPGYEKLAEFVKSRANIPQEQADLHRLRHGVHGVLLAGSPGTGKSVVAQQFAMLMGRILLKSNLSEMRDKWVGNSEKNVRRALQVAHAMKAVMWMDDCDKDSSVGGGGGAETSGTSSNTLQMMLQAMSDPAFAATIIMTCNRINRMPPELMRPGRIDRRFYVERPNDTTRRAILEHHLKLRNTTFVDDVVHLDHLVSVTNEWSGAELAQLVEDEVYLSVQDGTADHVNPARMLTAAKEFVPMIRQTAYAADIQQMEKDCTQFTRIGNVTESSPTVAGRVNARAARSTRASA